MRLFYKIKVTLLIVILVFTMTSCNHYFDDWQASLENAQEFYDEHKENIRIVWEYMNRYEFDSASIYKAEKTITLLKHTDSRYLDKIQFEIESDEVQKAVSVLHFDGNESIHIDGDVFCMVIWTGGSDFGAGIVYSPNDNTDEIKESIGYLTLLEPLEEKGWYYYEEDYNEYRLSR